MKPNDRRRVPVLVTAPENYASRFSAALLRACDDRLEYLPVVMPLIVTTASDEVEHLVADEYDYLIFTSRKAIMSMVEVMGKRHQTLTSCRCRCCAIGRDHEALSLLGDVTMLQAEEPSLMGIARRLEAEVPDHEARGGVHVAVLGPRVEGLTEPDTVPDFMTALSDMGFVVTYVAAYVTRRASDEVLRRASELVRQREVEWVAFTSATEAQVFRRMMGGVEVDGVGLACFGPYTCKCVRKEGFDVDFTSPDYSSFDAFAHHLKQHILDN